jgi:hypothetical protein
MFVGDMRNVKKRWEMSRSAGRHGKKKEKKFKGQ